MEILLTIIQLFGVYFGTIVIQQVIIWVLDHKLYFYFFGTRGSERQDLACHLIRVLGWIIMGVGGYSVIKNSGIF